LPTRLDKLIADSGLYSRREAKDLIKYGRVTINGEVASSPEEKFDGDRDEICVDGQAICCARFRYFMMYKPEGVLSATEDSRQETVLDLLPREIQNLQLFPVGRLDKDTTGLLILTNDGDYAHRVISPKHHVPKRYRAQVDGVLDEDDVKAFEQGIVLADGLECMPAKLEILAPNIGVATVFEGKYHQVKRMFASRGKSVTALHRMSIGALVLDEILKPGQFVELDAGRANLVFEK
jgi:16S rRNA pseudouridine516 synthase